MRQQRAEQQQQAMQMQQQMAGVEAMNKLGNTNLENSALQALGGMVGGALGGGA